MREFKPYIGPALILVLGLLLIYFLYRSFYFTENTEKFLALLLPVVGFVFAIFQVFLNIAVQSVRNKTHLRHTDYKELGKIMNSISELLNENMVKEVDAHGMVSSLWNRINEYTSFIDINASYLFPDIQNSTIATQIRDELRAILLISEKFRMEMEKASKSEFEQMVLKMNWHNGVRENLIRYNDFKSKLLKEIQTKYLK